MTPDELRHHFDRAFGRGPAPRVSRAPGRVNLIGEHTDYAGLPVLPMTISQAVLVAFRPRPDRRVGLQNTDPSYPPADFDNDLEIEPSPTGAWENYCKAAIQGINAMKAVNTPIGLDLLVSGGIPIAAGLSSSSAFVVACALAYLDVLEALPASDAARLELAAALADAERYVGTHGGGMDQAIILLGDERSACKIDFYPLRVERVPLFKDHTFVVCDSLVKASKSGNARQRYNAGPALTRLICALAEKQAQRTYDEQIRLEHLGDLWHGLLCLTHAEAAALLNECVPRPRMRLQEAADFLGMTPAQVRERYIGDLPEPPDGFPLQARARHQLTEFHRVELARDLMLAGDAAGFGALMDASHRSCADDFEVSCDELEALVAIARDSGSIGSRLTGAGFGGCTVNLVPDDAVDAFTRAVIQRYYIEYLRISDPARALQAAVFAAHAAAGASIM